MTITWKFTACNECSGTGKAYKVLVIEPLLGGPLSSNATVAYQTKLKWLNEPCQRCGGTLQVPHLYDGDWLWPD